MKEVPKIMSYILFAVILFHFLHFLFVWASRGLFRLRCVQRVGKQRGGTRLPRNPGVDQVAVLVAILLG